jgi:hypothetical protein
MIVEEALNRFFHHNNIDKARIGDRNSADYDAHLDALPKHLESWLETINPEDRAIFLRLFCSYTYITSAMAVMRYEWAINCLKKCLTERKLSLADALFITVESPGPAKSGGDHVRTDLCKGTNSAVSVADLCLSFGACYTRYADDITVSCDVDIAPIFKKLERIVNLHGFQLNHEKTRFFGYSKPKFITGLVVGEDIRVQKRFKRRLKQDIYFCKKFGVTTHLENSNADHFINYREHLYGKAYYIKMVEPEVGERFIVELDKIAWPGSNI